VSSEFSRIAKLASGHRLVVFSFWTGELPEISRLHFLTVANALPPGSRYILFVDKATISNSMLALLSRCMVDVVAVDLPQLMQESGLKKLLRRTPLSTKWGFVQRLFKDRARLARLSRLGHYHPMMRFTPRYNILFGGPPITGVRISNYVRVLISSLINTHTLYMDIDFALPRPLDWIYQHGSFVYSWQRRPFANSALMSVRSDSPIKSGALIDLLEREGTGRPWILFSEENCRACGLEILSCDRLDPLWSKTNPSGQKFAEFFTRRDDSEETLRVLRREFDAIHWHNRWNEIPDPGSPYSLWLNELTSLPSQQTEAKREPLAQAPSSESSCVN
jgi:hypothetical protein